MKMPEKIETDRLVLVPVSLDYLENIFSEVTPEITKYMSFPSPTKIDETKVWLDGAIENYKSETDFDFIILDNDTNEFIGCGGINHLDTKTPELGIWTKKSSHGHKYGREAVTGAELWAKENLDYDYLKYPVFADNIPSRKIQNPLAVRLITNMWTRMVQVLN